MTQPVTVAQAQLRTLYKNTPESAWITNQAVTESDSIDDPFHARALTGRHGHDAVAFGVHSGVGGPYDAPCPGDLLCAALAACQDASIRLVAHLMGIELRSLRVTVRAGADLRGAMGLEKNVPVGFQSIDIEVQLTAKDGTPPEMLERLQVAAQRCCVVSQTLQAPPPVTTRFLLHEAALG